MRPRQYGSMTAWDFDADARLIELFHANALTIEEIGREVGRSGGAVRSRLTKLRQDGRVKKKRPGAHRAGKEPTTIVDVVLAIDMLIDTRIRRDRLGTARDTHEDALNEADVRSNNALRNLENVLGRWKR